jgi:hypothetical protein
MRLISGFIDTYLRLNAQEVLIFRKEADTLDGNEKGKVMELTTSWKEEGRLEESQQLVLRQLRRRWGQLPPAMVAQLQTLAVEEMENLAEALLDFTSLADLENWLASRSTPPKA